MALPVCTISETGILRPDYDTVLDYFEEEFRRIYGPDIYIEPDSQDGQMLALFALAVHDCNGQAVQTYNSFSPSSARGAGLSLNVKINGLRRKVASYSSVDLEIVGQAGTTITGGIAKDTAGNQWLLPDTVTIPVDGDIVVTARARDAGAIQAVSGSITTIGTPTRGWQSVSNPSPATPGAPIESDGELRRRQTLSTSLPSQTIFEGTVGAVAQVAGVVRYRGYENDTSGTDADGLPAHSIALVVEGGDATVIAETIAARKSPGTVTYGTTSVDITDEYGVTRAIKFFRPTDVTVGATISLRARPGYTTAVENSIRQTVADWLTDLPIGDDVIWARVFLPANLFGGVDSQKFEIVGITLSKNGGSFAAADVSVDFDEAVVSEISDILISVVT